MRLAGALKFQCAFEVSQSPSRGEIGPEALPCPILDVLALRIRQLISQFLEKFGLLQ